MTWLPGDLTVEVNGKVVAHWTGADAVPDDPMGFGAMGYVGTSADAWMGGGPNGSTPSTVTYEIDNVVMSQWAGIA
ncbi:hypothetical protein JMJ56_30400 [Belnapia sp. T18]|uniref:Uncharacterized protein n=1 Tax=Belnapia arida TaxID=2804533 RepID=A0ABS1UCP8_9PROT|nr:hypothetical protein [Belnapia arida]MBL6082290.1 hypothetical protein [Belnapia arida]